MLREHLAQIMRELNQDTSNAGVVVGTECYFVTACSVETQYIERTDILLAHIAGRHGSREDASVPLPLARCGTNAFHPLAGGVLSRTVPIAKVVLRGGHGDREKKCLLHG
jgi:hypothetical protein